MKTQKIENNNIANRFTPTRFGSAGALGMGLQAAEKFLLLQEGGAGLAHYKFVQNTGASVVPRVTFSRSPADFMETAFLELGEGVLVFYFPGLLGEKLFRKLHSRKLSQEAKSLVATPASELLKTGMNNADAAIHTKAAMPVKAAIALGCLAVPLLLFAQNYIKNLMTLKIFKQGNFEKIANLDKNADIDENLNKKVEKSAKKNILRAGLAYLGCLGLGALLVKKGQSSNALKNISEAILAPGTKFFKGTKKEGFFNKFFGLDFRNNNGKLSMGHGQLTASVAVAGLGYLGSSHDRGKQNFQETLFRFPIVGLYIVCGNELLEKGFKAALVKMGKCKDVLNKNREVTAFKDLKASAEIIAAKERIDSSAVYKRMLKQKTILTAVPLLFGIGVMGFFLAGSSVLFTKYRYKKEQAEKVAAKDNIVKNK